MAPAAAGGSSATSGIGQRLPAQGSSDNKTVHTCVGRHGTDDVKANDGDESPNTRRQDLHGEDLGGAKSGGKLIFFGVRGKSKTGRFLQRPGTSGLHIFI